MSWWWNLLVSAGQMVLEGLVEGATQTVADWVSGALTKVTKGLSQMLESQTGLLGWLGDRGAELLKNVSGAIQDNVAASLNTINKMAQKQLGVWHATERNLRKLTGWVTGKFQDVTRWVGNQLRPTLSKVGDQLGFTQQTVKQIAKNKRGLSERGMEAFGLYLRENGESTVTRAEARQSGVLQWLKKKGTWLKNQVTGGFNQALGWLKKKGVKMASTVAAFVSGIGQALYNAILFLLHGIAKLLDVDPEEIADIYGQLLQNFLPGELGPAEGGEGPPAYRA